MDGTITQGFYRHTNIIRILSAESRCQHLVKVGERRRVHVGVDASIYLCVISYYVLYVYICKYYVKYMCIHMCIYIYIYMYVHIYIYIYIERERDI